MATLIVQCRNCQKEITNEVDLSEPGTEEIVGVSLKNGVLCEVCTAEYNRSVDECYFNEQKDPLHQYPLPRGFAKSMDITWEPPQWLMQKLVDQEMKQFIPPSMVAYCDPKEPGNIKFMAGKPGTTLKIKRYKPLALPTESMFTEGAPEKPYPKLELEPMDEV